MRRLAMLIVCAAALVGGCRRQVDVGSPATPALPGGTGGATAREAVERFMTAARVQDLDAMSQVWGTTSGPVRSTMNRQEWEMREVVFMRCLRHDSWRVLGESPAAGGERLMIIETRFKDLTRSTNFYAVMGPQQRWYVRAFDMPPLEAICQRPL